MTTLSELVSQFRFHERRLRESVDKGLPATDCAEALRRCADALDRIETHAPLSPQEARDQVYFFLRRGMERSTIRISNRDLDIALALAARTYADAPPTRRPGAGMWPGPHIVSVAEYVAASVERVSLIDTEFRYVATSCANADFYGSRPIRFVGAHVGEFIGRARFEQRGKRNLENCFKGIPKSYFHSIDLGDTRRIMSCQMKAVRRETGEIEGAVVYMRDVTSELPRLIEEASLV